MVEAKFGNIALGTSLNALKFHRDPLCVAETRAVRIRAALVRFGLISGVRSESLEAMLTTPLGRLRVVGLLEGISFLLLLGIAMPLKYFAGQPLAVRYVGMAHGILFLLYLLAIVPVALDFRWRLKTIGLAVLASFLPCGPFVLDAKVLKSLAAGQR
jgi:integral membrane protein